jgi:hypothetical protein
MAPLFLFSFLIFAEQARAWENCYEEDMGSGATPVLKIIETFHRLAETSSGQPGIELWVKGKLHQPLLSGRYQVELWHQETGSRVHYKGPYDLCCGFLAESVCGSRVVIKSMVGENEREEVQQTDCPMYNEEFVASVTKPLHMNEGDYEATIKIFGVASKIRQKDEGGEGGEGGRSERKQTEEEELACVVIPFELGKSKARTHAPPPEEEAEQGSPTLSGQKSHRRQHIEQRREVIGEEEESELLFLGS